MLGDRGVETGARPVQPSLADVGELLAALPQREGVLQRLAAGLELGDDLAQLGPRLLVGRLGHEAKLRDGGLELAAGDPDAQHAQGLGRLTHDGAVGAAHDRVSAIEGGLR